MKNTNTKNIKRRYSVGFVTVSMLAMVGFLASCQKDTGVTGIPASESDSSSSSSSCTTKVVDYGLKGATTVVQRGLHSDTKVDPATGYPAVAYTEASATGGNLTISLSYWNGSEFVTEVAAGDGVGAAAGSAQMIRLAFLSNGTPMIYWTTATTTGLKMVGRNVALSSSTAASWTYGVIDSVSVASTAVEVAVNPLDQVGVHFMHASAIATAQGRFVYCTSNCNLPSSYSAMTTATDFIDLVGATAGPQSSVGMAWCKASDSLYYPAVTYVGNGAFTRYAVCLSSPANCGTTGAWSKLNVIGAGGTSIGTKLYIDPTVVGDSPKVLARVVGGTTITPYQGGQSCTAIPTSFITGQAVGASGATTGNAWMSLLRDSTGRFHVVANEGTASVSYFNQTAATGFATATWNNAGTVDTTTLPAAFAGVGGAALDSTGSTLFVSYGMTVAPNNVALGVVSGPLSNPSTTNTFSLFYPNQNGAIQSNIFSVFQHRNVDSEQTSLGRPGVAYVDYSAGGATVAASAGRLKYAFRDSASASSSWLVNTIPGTTNPNFPALAYDSQNYPWISYWEEASFGAAKKYHLVTNSRTDGTGTWRSYQFPLASKTTIATQPAFDETALAMYTSGGITYPVMITANSHATGIGIRASRLDPRNGSWTSMAVIDTIASGIGNLSSDYDSNGNIVVAYYDIASTRAKYAHSSDGGVTWTTAVTASPVAGSGQGVAIKLHAGIPAISYYNKAANNVFYNKCTLTTAALCANVSGWIAAVQVNAAGSNVGVSGLGNPVQSLQTALSFTSTGVAEVYYALGAGASSQAGLIKGVNTVAAPTVFTTSTVNEAINSTTGVNGAASVSNGALSGFSAATSRSTYSNSNSTAYVGPGNWLYATTCGD
jgi:hypothetical protein